MAELSRFYGIIISMYAGDHNPPHFHAKYSGTEIMIDIEEVSLLKGDPPKKMLKIVLAWAEVYKKKLLQCWDDIQNGSEPQKIPPIKFK